MKDKIGFIKNIIICIYDLMLLFSILFFLSLPLVSFTSGEVISNNIFYQLYLLIIILAYYIWFWVNHNQTLGMKSWKIILLNKDGTRNITITKCILRILFAVLGGHLLLLIHKKSLHDLISGTYMARIE
ncbi:MAG: hypothetical protein CMD43_02765 [Gammaproteobacteria bacterium]|nr:hypothetical protein [Gammaproteobacteria bacterium]|tara:strand:- start:8035 stop:8421 length:387 start_codon:yes stop_codon:yes gene_type:complete